MDGDGDGPAAPRGAATACARPGDASSSCLMALGRLGWPRSPGRHLLSVRRARPVAALPWWALAPRLRRHRGLRPAHPVQARGADRLDQRAAARPRAVLRLTPAAAGRPAGRLGGDHGPAPPLLAAEDACGTWPSSACRPSVAVALFRLISGGRGRSQPARLGWAPTPARSRPTAVASVALALVVAVYEGDLPAAAAPPGHGHRRPGRARSWSPRAWSRSLSLTASPAQRGAAPAHRRRRCCSPTGPTPRWPTGT